MPVISVFSGLVFPEAAFKLLWLGVDGSIEVICMFYAASMYLSPVKVSENETISMKEYKALQKKIKDLEIENEILKKATAIFAKDP